MYLLLMSLFDLFVSFYEVSEKPLLRLSITQRVRRRSHCMSKKDLDTGPWCRVMFSTQPQPHQPHQ
jgi:hypothetical protein